MLRMAPRYESMIFDWVQRIDSIWPGDQMADIRDGGSIVPLIAAPMPLLVSAFVTTAAFALFGWLYSRAALGNFAAISGAYDGYIGQIFAAHLTGGVIAFLLWN
mgnify:CR=1 FL=1